MKSRILAGVTAAIVGTVTAVVLIPQVAYAAEARAVFTEAQLRNPISMSHVNQLLATPGGEALLETRAGVNGTTCSSWPVYYSSYANGLYVSVELGYTGSRHAMLRARAYERGPWEEFEECWYINTAGKYVFTLRSLANWKYVAVEYDYGGSLTRMLRARSNVADIWERFYIGVPQNWHMNLQSVWIGYYVSVELAYGGNDYGMLRARATQFGPWEDLGSS